MLMSCVTPPAGNQSTMTQEGPSLFAPHTSCGYVTSDHTGRSVVVLRDSGAAQSLIVKSSLPEGVSVDGRPEVILVGFPRTQYIAPLVPVHLDSPYFSGTCALAVVDTLPVAGIDVVLANDLVTDWSTNHPKVADEFTRTARSEVTGNGNVQVKTDPDLNMSNLSSPPQIDSYLAVSPDSLDKEHEVKKAEVPELEERPRVQTPTDTNESGAKAEVCLRYGKLQRVVDQPEIPQTSEVCEVPVSLKDHRTGTRNAVCGQPSSVPRHRKVSSHPRSRRNQSVLERCEMTPLLDIAVETWKITSGRSLPSICKFPLCRKWLGEKFRGQDSLISPVHSISKSIWSCVALLIWFVFFIEPQTKFFLVGRCYEPGFNVRAWSSDKHAICGSAPETPAKRTTTPSEDSVYWPRGPVSSLVQRSTPPLLTSGEVVLRRQRHLWSGYVGRLYLSL
ncbi:uncharacterized protein [Procambarus clarkii]|uniref:uncharacterized protein n=1 Tax=Procambarus clarkii TaxID=6728 RepID=UPI0037420A34